MFPFVQRCEEMLLHGSLGQRFAVLWLLLGVAATCIATVSALWQLGLRGAVRYFFSDWQSIFERRRHNELRPVQRWALLFLCLGLGWFGLLTLLQILTPTVPTIRASCGFSCCGVRLAVSTAGFSRRLAS